MADVLVRTGDVDRAACNGVGGSSHSKKRSSNNKRNSVDGDSQQQEQALSSTSATTSVSSHEKQQQRSSKRNSAGSSGNVSGTKLKRHTSSTSKDGTLSVTSGSSHHSSLRNHQGGKRKPKSATTTSSSESNRGTKSSSGNNKKKPASRAKSFDGSTPPVRRSSHHNKKTSSAIVRADKLRKQKSSSALSIRSEDREEHKPEAKLRKELRKKEQQKGMLKFMSHLEEFQTPKGQIVHDLFVKRKPSKQQMAIPSLTPTDEQQESNTSSKEQEGSNHRSRKSKSDSMGTNTSSRHNKRSSNKETLSTGGRRPSDPTLEAETPYFPKEQAPKGFSSQHQQPSPTTKISKRSSKMDNNDNNQFQNSPVPVRRRSDPTLEHDWDSDDDDDSEQDVSEEYELNRSQSEELADDSFYHDNDDKIKNDEKDELNQHHDTLAPGHAYYEQSEKSISAFSAHRKSAASFTFEESRGLSIMDSKSSIRTSLTHQASSRSSNTFANASTGSKSTGSNSNNDSDSRSQRPRNHQSGNSNHSSSRSADDVRKERLARKQKRTASGSQPESLLTTVTDSIPRDEDNSIGDEEEFVEHLVSHDVGDDNDFREDEDDDDFDDDEVTNRRKSLCGLFPATHRAVTGESSVAGSVLPSLMDSSFSSMHSMDETVCTYLSKKEPGLIVAAEVSEGPMKNFLGNLTSAIEKKQTSEPTAVAQRSFSHSDGSQSTNSLQELFGGKDKVDKKKSHRGQKLGLAALNSSMNASFNASALSSGHLARAAASALGPHPSQENDSLMEDESVPSLLSCRTESSAPALHPALDGKTPPPKKRPMGDESCPSLMSYGVQDDASMPGLSTYRTGGTAGTSGSEIDSGVRDDESMPSLSSMPDEASVPSLARKKMHTGETDEDEVEELDSESEPEEQAYEEQYEGEEYEDDEASEYEESLTDEEDIDNSFLQEEEHDDDIGQETDEETLKFGEGTEDDEIYQECDAHDADEDDYTLEEEDEEETEALRKPVAGPNVQGPAPPSQRRPNSEVRSGRGGGKGAKRPQNQRQIQKGRGPSSQRQKQQETRDSTAVQFVVKSKPKKNSKRGKHTKKQEQIQQWKEEFQQEELLQQQQQQQQQQQDTEQQMIWQQEQQQIRVQQQYWINNQGMNTPGFQMEAPGSMMGNPVQMMNQAGQKIDISGHSKASGGMMNSGHSMASGAVTSHSGHSMASGSLLSDSDHQSQTFQHHQAGAKPKKSILKKSQSLEYDFSFMDNPEIPQVEDVDADDILKPMNPSQADEGGNIDKAPKPPSRGKKKERDKKGSITSRFKKSVKKIMKPSSGGTKKSLIDTGLNDKQFFPDLDEDDDEEFTMKGLLSS